MPTATFLWRIELRVPAHAIPHFEEALRPDCMSVSAFVEGSTHDPDADWRVEGLTGAEPDARAVALRLAKAARAFGIETPKAKIHLVPPRDWAAENMAEFPPLRVGRYFIHGSHFKGRPPAGRVAIQLDVGAAFGSGEHASTAACLMALDGLAKKRRFLKPLDLGCGSGILALAIAKTWRVRVLASDIDPIAVDVTTRNARVNGIGKLIRTACGPGYRSPGLARGAPYDLIAANILAGPLVHMAGDLKRHLAPGGVAIVSGLLERDGRWVIAAHRHFGLKLIDTITVDGWQTLLMAR